MPDALKQAIFQAEPERLQRTLMKVIMDLKGRQLVADELLMETTSPNAPSSSNTTPPKKIRHPRYVACHNCKCEIDLKNPDRTGCRWHTGTYTNTTHFPKDAHTNSWFFLGCLKLSHRDSVWSGYRSVMLPSAKDAAEWNMPGFRWSCCGGEAGHAGCRSGDHVVDEALHVKRTEFGEGRSLLLRCGEMTWENWDAKE